MAKRNVRVDQMASVIANHMSDVYSTGSVVIAAIKAIAQSSEFDSHPMRETLMQAAHRFENTINRPVGE